MTNKKYTSWGDAPAILSTQQVADLLGVHLNTVIKLCSSGEIPAAKVGRAWRIDKAVLQRWFEEKSQRRTDD